MHCSDSRTLLSLPHEVLIEILSCCTLDSILVLEQTCKRLQELCLDRSIWLSRLDHSKIQHIPDLPPHRSLDVMSNIELKDKLISSIRKDFRWTTPGKMTLPRVVTMQFGDNVVNRDALVEPRLLPGAKELLSILSGRLELWSIDRQELMWRAPLAREGYVCLAFEFELIHDNELVVAVIDAEEGFSQTCLLQVLSVDLVERSHKRHFSGELPWGFFFRMMLKGDILMVPMPAMGLETLLLNWRTGGRIVLEHVDSHNSTLDIRGTVLADDCIVTIANLDDVFCAILLPLDAVEGRWTFDSSRDVPVDQKVRPTKSMQIILPLPVPSQQEREAARSFEPEAPLEDWSPYLLGHRVFTPHWRPNAPTEILVAASHVDVWTEMQLLSYRLQVSRKAVPASVAPTGRAHTKYTLSLVSTTCVPSPELPWNPCSLSNTGHMFTLDTRLRCFSLLVDEGEQPMNIISLGSEFLIAQNAFQPILSAVEPWSGNIAVRICGEVKVLYFD